jgi:hypothetical protein
MRTRMPPTMEYCAGMCMNAHALYPCVLQMDSRGCCFISFLFASKNRETITTTLMMGINNNPYDGVNRCGLLSPLNQVKLTKSVVLGVFQSKSLDIYYIFFSKKAKSGYNWSFANISRESSVPYFRIYFRQ